MQLEETISNKLKNIIDSDPEVLFMKGNREMPQCGFSAKVVEALDQMVPDYLTINVLEDPSIREGIKAFSAWPTIPQLYIRGEFVGGECDVESRDRLQLVQCAASVAQAPSRDHGDAKASGRTNWREYEARLVAHTAGGVFVDEQRPRRPGEHVARVGHTTGEGQRLLVGEPPGKRPSEPGRRLRTGDGTVHNSRHERTDLLVALNVPIAHSGEQVSYRGHRSSVLSPLHPTSHAPSG